MLYYNQPASNLMRDPQGKGSVLLGSVPGQDVAQGAAQPLSADQDKYSMLCAFIQEASARGIVAGVQATLLQDLAGALCRTQGTTASELASAAAQAVSQPSAEAQHTTKPEPCTVGITGIPAAVAEAQPSTAALVAAAPPIVEVSTAAAENGSSGEPAAFWGLLQQPQLQIKPLDLHLGTVGASAAVGVHVSSSSPVHLQDSAATAALSQHAASDLGIDMSVMRAAAESLARTRAVMNRQGYADFFPGATSAEAAQQEQQRQQQQQQQFVASCTDSLTALHGSTTDATVAAAAALSSAIHGSALAQDPVLAAAAAAAPAVSPAAASHSQAMRSGSRKHRFTKEQQQAILESVERNYALYPSRYTELVIKQMQERFPGIEISNACVRKIKFRANEANRQSGDAVRRDSLAAADAAQGLVGLAAAAASCELPAAAAAAPVRSMGTAVSGSFAVTGTTSDVDTADAEDRAFSREPSVAPGSGNNQQQAAAAAEVVPSPKQQQQRCESTAVPAAAAAAVLQEVVAKVADDGAVDTAAVEAAEGLHMLMKGSESVADAAAASAAAAAAAAPGSLKRKLDVSVTTAAAGGGDVAGHTSKQIAEALAAAAGLAASSTPAVAAAAATGTGIATQQQQQQLAWQVAAAAATPASSSPAAQLAQLQQLVQLQQQQQAVHPGSVAALQQYNCAPASSAVAATVATPAASSAGRGMSAPAAKRQRLNGVQMAELVASVRHHVQVNPERYTHCVIRDMKEKYPDLELNMGQIRKIKFRTLGNINPKQGARQQQQQPHPAAVCCAAAPQDAQVATAAHSTAAAAGAAVAVDVSDYPLGGSMHVAAVNAAKLLAAAAAQQQQQQQSAIGTCAAAAAGTETTSMPGPAAAGADN